MDQAQANLRRAEAEHPGNTPQVAEAMLELIELEIEAVPATDALLNEARRAMAVAEGAEGKESGLYAKAMADEAWVYMKMERAELAQPVAEEALAIAQRAGDPDKVALAAAALGNICANLRDDACYLRNAEISVKAIRTAKDTEPIDFASYLLDLLEARRRNKDIPGATAALNEILAIAAKEDAKGTETGQRWAGVEDDAGAFYVLTYQWEPAILHLKKAVDLLTKAYGPESTALNAPLSNLAMALVCAGHTDESLQTYERARQIYLKMYGPNSSRMGYVEAGYASVLNFKGRYQEASDMALHAHRNTRQRLTLAIRLLPERQALGLATEGDVEFNTAVSIAALHPEIRIADVYQEVVRSRALVTEEMAQREAALSRKLDPAIAALEKEMDADRRAVMETQSSGGSAQALSDATAKMEHTERELAARSAGFRVGERTRSSDLEDLRHNLPTQSVLISYVRYTQYRMRKDKYSADWIPSYMAFVLHPGAEPVSLYNLGDAKTIDELIGKMRASADAEAHAGGMGAARNEREYRLAGEQLRKLIWDPLAGELKDAQLALIVPDGVLNLVPFTGLPDAKAISWSTGQSYIFYQRARPDSCRGAEPTRPACWPWAAPRSTWRAHCPRPATRRR